MKNKSNTDTNTQAINHSVNTLVISMAVFAGAMILSACSSLQSSQQKQVTHINSQVNKKLTNSEVLQAYKQKRQQVYANNNSANTSSANQNVKKQQTIIKIQSEQNINSYTTTDSGLKYKVLREGTGTSPTVKDTVTVHYEGKLTSGQVFDSSYQRNEPTTFPLNGVIPGWTEGLQLAQEGGKYEFYIPAYLAYGSRGAGNSIPPDSPLIFTVELIEVN